MFKLEKVFQNDDSAYILFTNVIKSILIYFSIYIFSILEKNSVYEILDYEIYLQSNFFYLSIFLSIFYLIFISLNKRDNVYKRNLISFFAEDFINLTLSMLISLIIIFILKLNLSIDNIFLYLFIFIISIIGFAKLFFNSLYENLIQKNIIQKNIMLVGNYDEIKEILNNDFDKIYVFKCCIVLDIAKYNLNLIKSEFKFPIFTNDEDIRSILEYHALGQVWLLDKGNHKIENSLLKILKYSVDILIIKLHKKYNLKGKKLLINKYDFEFYEISRFHGVNLFVKILLDKIFALIFLILTFPILLIAAILIYFEDGFPILFTQNRTGWDGRRFKIYKLRTLKKENFDKTVQVNKGDKRVLKFGKLIRRYSIDELPQFINVFFGDMSIVGPRPHMVEHDIQYAKLFGNFLKRHKCNPGLTGWAQVNGLRGATPNPDAMKRRMEFDLWYLNNWSIWLDFYVMIKTFYAIIKYKGD
jgi:exopolysaccharide biosynthesis polyprenyl glycosylphosphotransferase